MCGRYMITSAREAIKRVFDVPTLFELAPRYNVAPTQDWSCPGLVDGYGFGRAGGSLLLS